MSSSGKRKEEERRIILGTAHNSYGYGALHFRLNSAKSNFVYPPDVILKQ